MNVWQRIWQTISRRVLFRVEETILVSLRTRYIHSHFAWDGDGVVQWDIKTKDAWISPKHHVYPMFTLEVQQWVVENLRYRCTVRYDDEFMALRFIRHHIGDRALIRICFVNRDEAIAFKMRWL